MPVHYHRIVPASPAFRDDGTLYSERFDDVYAAAEGTLAQARHVFLRGNGLPQRWQADASFTVLETGFGAGLNFLAAWQLWRETAAASSRLHYVSVEKHPFLPGDLARIHGRYPELESLSQALCTDYPPLVPGFHRLHLDRNRVTLTLLFGDAAEMLRQLEARVNAFFLDGFAPSKNPDMWGDAVCAELARLAGPGATAATYSVASSVRDSLTRAGFMVEKRAGFANKRQMLCARYSGTAAQAPARQERRALVIGAGLAGSACAGSLAARGWQVEVLERHPAAAQEASGNPAGLLRPVFSPDWNTHSRFTVASFLYALRHHAALERAGFPVTRGEGGVLQLARDSRQFEKQQGLLAAFGLPVDLVQLADWTLATELAGTPTSGPGLWFAQAAWVAPASICLASLQAAGDGSIVRFGTAVSGLVRENGLWVATDSCGQRLAAAPVAVLANAHLASALSPAARLPLRAVRGQVSLFPAVGIGRVPRIAVCREGYVTPPVAGMHCLGATFNEDMFEPALRAEDHAANFQRLQRMLPAFSAGVDTTNFGGRVAFRAMSPDRLPLLGAVPGQTGLHACLGLGSRGMTWSALAADVVASAIAGEPMPLERDLLQALDVGRFESKTGARSEGRGTRGEQ